MTRNKKSTMNIKNQTTDRRKKIHFSNKEEINVSFILLNQVTSM